MKSFYLSMLAVATALLLSCSSTTEPKTSTQLQNQLMPLEVGNWWKYQKFFGYDTTGYTEWHVQKVENRDTMITATIAYHTYRKGNEQDTLTSGTFYIHENDNILIMDSSFVLRANTIPNKNIKYGVGGTQDSRITQEGLYYVGSRDSITVPIGTFYNVQTFAPFSKEGFSLIASDAGAVNEISKRIGVIRTWGFRWRSELVEYSLK